MLKIHLDAEDFFDEDTSHIVTLSAIDIELEHSLISLAKWEARHEKPILGKFEECSSEEIFAYIYSMIVTPDVPEDIVYRFDEDVLTQINSYIEGRHSATWFNETLNKEDPSKEAITSELIYYWIFSLGIPIECEYWNLNRLFSLIRIYNIKNGKPKKRTSQEIAADYRALNEKRKAQLKTKG